MEGGAVGDEVEDSTKDVEVGEFKEGTESSLVISKDLV